MSQMTHNEVALTEMGCYSFGRCQINTKKARDI